MTVYDARSIPAEVRGSGKDPHIAEWLKTGPVLGGPLPVHAQRREHDAFIDADKPPIATIEHLGLRGPHGTIIVRVYHPSKPGPADGAAMIYLHGGGFVVGSLDQFETAMRLLAEGSGAQVWRVDYKLAPEYRWPGQIDENEFVVRWLFEHAAERGVDPGRIALSSDSAGGNMICVIALKLRDEGGRDREPYRWICGYGRSISRLVPAAARCGLHATLRDADERDEPRRSATDDPRDLRLRHAARRRPRICAQARRCRQRNHLRAPRGSAARIHSDDAHSGRCLEATEELARLLGAALVDKRA